MDAIELTDNQREALRSIWPAHGCTPLTWPRWVARADIDALERMGLINETDLTDLGRAVLKGAITDQGDKS